MVGVVARATARAVVGRAVAVRWEHSRKSGRRSGRTSGVTTQTSLCLGKVISKMVA